jgi:hypothetical protein
MMQRNTITQRAHRTQIYMYSWVSFVTISQRNLHYSAVNAVYDPCPSLPSYGLAESSPLHVYNVARLFYTEPSRLPQSSTMGTALKTWGEYINRAVNTYSNLYRA